MALLTKRVKGNYSRRCSSHQTESCAKKNYVCNKVLLDNIPEGSKILLRQRNLTVFSQQTDRNAFKIIPRKQDVDNLKNIPMGPFCIGNDNFIHEMYSCSLNSTNEYLVVAACVSSIQRSIKCLSCFVVIFCVKTRAVIKRTIVEADMPVACTFHPTNPDIYYSCYYDPMEDINILQCAHIFKGTLNYTYLPMIDLECENIMTLNTHGDYLILQILQADLKPPYYENKIYLLSLKTLKVLQKVENMICAPCHTSCTLNYTPDMTYMDGHIAISFPYTEKEDTISITTKSTNVLNKNHDFINIARIPSTFVPSLKSLVKASLRENITCDTCIDTLSLPPKLKRYLSHTE